MLSMPSKTSIAFCAALVALSNGEDVTCQGSSCPEDENALLQLSRSSEKMMGKSSPAEALLQSVHAITEKVKAGDDPTGCAQASSAASEAVTAGLTAIAAQHTHQVNQVNIAKTAVETCATRSVDGLAMVTQQGDNLATKRTEHETCRNQQAVNDATENTACEAWAAHRNGLGDQVCHSYPQADSSAAWVTAAETAKSAAVLAWSEGQRLQEACATAGTAASDSLTTCATKQVEFERDYCAHRASCADLQICRANQEDNFIAVRAEVEAAMEDIVAEFLVMKHAQCLLTQVEAALSSETHSEIISDAACDTPADVSELDIIWPEFETLVTCDNTILTRPPCEAAFFEAEYGALPGSLSETVRDACTACSPLPIADAPVSWVRQLGYIDLSNIVPAEGSPSGCECTVVELTGEFSPGPLVKCMNCLTTYRSTDPNSCPSGFKVYSPRSRDDWRTIQASGIFNDVDKPYHIVDVTRPQDHCGGCTSHAMNSDVPGQSSWVTSDGSPWFLRENAYGEPNGDYDANCYLALWSPQDGQVSFNDGSCSYHSSSYFCQLAADAQLVTSLQSQQGDWSLVMKSNGDTTLAYDATQWTTTTLLNENSPAESPGNAKYAAFNTAAVSEIKICIGDHHTNCFEHSLQSTYSSALALFTAGYVRDDTFSKDEFIGLFGPPNTYRVCDRLQRPGFNTVGTQECKARFGFCFNKPGQNCQPEDSNDSDGAFGIGLSDVGMGNHVGAGWTHEFVSPYANGRKNMWLYVK